MVKLCFHFLVRIVSVVGSSCKLFNAAFNIYSFLLCVYKHFRLNAVCIKLHASTLIICFNGKMLFIFNDFLAIAHSFSR